MPSVPGAEERTLSGHEHRHGKPASWVLVGVIIVAFVLGGVAIIIREWWLFWACAGVVALSIPAGKVIGIMGDTVLVEAGADTVPPAEDTGSVADPGVRVE
ncbi:MAG: hypothetical protein JOY82_15710 [Streptosporangiaceae bacterium]|nr:hypothetical protein [Streptosporangiaceae bacterium]MBV9855937.1 hypothetical protein [Streptosporangiaceae bacterium]